MDELFSKDPVNFFNFLGVLIKGRSNRTHINGFEDHCSAIELYPSYKCLRTGTAIGRSSTPFTYSESISLYWYVSLLDLNVMRI